MEEYGNYRIALDRQWSLEDLYKFPRTFEQAYFFFASIDPDLDKTSQQRIARAYESFPWQGGYSAVGFFDQLKFSVDRRKRPKIVAIQKASPGFLELSLVIGVAFSLAKIVKHLAGGIDAANSTYNNIYKGMQERKLLKLKVEREVLKLDKEHIDFIDSGSRKMAKLLGFSSPAKLNNFTNDPYLTLKILFSVYRRVRTLAQYESSGKAQLSVTAVSAPPPKQNERAAGRLRKRKPRKRLASPR